MDVALFLFGKRQARQEGYMKVKSALEDWNQLLHRLKVPATHCFRESMRQKIFEAAAMLSP